MGERVCSHAEAVYVPRFFLSVLWDERLVCPCGMWKPFDYGKWRPAGTTTEVER